MPDIKDPRQKELSLTIQDLLARGNMIDRVAGEPMIQPLTRFHISLNGSCYNIDFKVGRSVNASYWSLQDYTKPLLVCQFLGSLLCLYFFSFPFFFTLSCCFFTSHVIGYRIGAMCLCVSTLTTEPFDLWSTLIRHGVDLDLS